MFTIAQSHPFPSNPNNFTDRTIHIVFSYCSVKTVCEMPEIDLQDLLTLADSSANSIEKLVLDGGKIPEVSSC